MEDLFAQYDIRYEPLRARNGHEVMSADMRAVNECIAGGPSVFRLYTWDPWCVSLGYHQSESDVDLRAIEDRGWILTRRPTGGRAVLHAAELTYSVILPLRRLSQHHIYRIIHEGIVEAVQRLGITDLEFGPATSIVSPASLGSGDVRRLACFASNARNEIEWQGRKVVGSAQRLFGEVLLQHGSILLADGHEQLAEVSASARRAGTTETLRSVIQQQAATLSEIALRTVSAAEVAQSIESVFVPKVPG